MTQVPVCVDLDGTLIRSDLLVESFFAMLKARPLSVFLLPLWLLRGRAHLKEQIARRAELDVSVLPYDLRVLEWVQKQREEGRSLWLCTASHRSYAERVAGHLGLFERVLATETGRNLSGRAKRERLCEELGEGGFDYVGNAPVDLHIWSHARRAIVVDESGRLADQAARLTEVEQVFTVARPSLRIYARALRLHQWLKNVLLFVPLVAAHQLGDGSQVGAAMVAFLAFGFCASSVYLLNDLLDLPADRHHPRKCHRPLASGALPLLHGALLVPVLLVAGLLLASLLPPTFFAVLLAYLIMTLGYSLYLKRVVMLDVVVLAGLYTIRILAGAAAIGGGYSSWLLAFSMFLFLSLALVKRYAELREMLRRGREEAKGRGYQVRDLALLQSLGAASGYLAVLVLALYIDSAASHALYRRPEVIWLLCPLMLFWVSRMWLKTHRDEMHDDPVVFALEDRVSLCVLALGAAVVAGAV